MRNADLEVPRPLLVCELLPEEEEEEEEEEDNNNYNNNNNNNNRKTNKKTNNNDLGRFVSQLRMEVKNNYKPT